MLMTSGKDIARQNNKKEKRNSSGGSNAHDSLFAVLWLFCEDKCKLPAHALSKQNASVEFLNKTSIDSTNSYLRSAVPPFRYIGR